MFSFKRIKQSRQLSRQFKMFCPTTETEVPLGRHPMPQDCILELDNMFAYITRVIMRRSQLCRYLQFDIYVCNSSNKYKDLFVISFKRIHMF